jgi:uncharacterized delta-60 repeat protein
MNHMKKICLLLLITINTGFGQTLIDDTSFVTGTGFDNWSGFGTITIDSAQSQPDGKIIVVGQYINYNGTEAKCIIRLNSDGTKDTFFNAGTGTNAGIWGATLQSDGKILIFGGFTNYNGTTANRITRLTSTGAKDPNFTIGSGPNDYLEAVKIQADGKIIIGGSFTSYNGTTVNGVARLNSNGTLDTSFNTGGAGADDRIRDILIQSDGKILVGGDFNNFNGVSKKRLVRLNTDGTIDTAYNIGGTGPLNNIWTMALQTDGKLIIGGEFQAYNGTGRNRIARINTDGTLDITFIIGSGASSTVMSLLADTDGKIYIGGSFTTYAGTGRTRFARLNSDGSLDTTLTIGTGFDDWVKSITKQQDNKLLIGGNFTTYNGATKNRVLRTNAVSLGIADVDKNYFIIYPSPATELLYITNEEKIDRYTITDINGRLVADDIMDGNLINIKSLHRGVYFLTLTEGNLKVTRKFIKN